MRGLSEKKEKLKGQQRNICGLWKKNMNMNIFREFLVRAKIDISQNA